MADQQVEVPAEAAAWFAAGLEQGRAEGHAALAKWLEEAAKGARQQQPGLVQRAQAALRVAQGAPRRTLRARVRAAVRAALEG